MLALKISVYSVVFFFLGIFVFGFWRVIPAGHPAARIWKIDWRLNRINSARFNPALKGHDAHWSFPALCRW